MITVDFTGSEVTLPKAASLVDAAYKRIDKPLKFDGGATVDAASAFLKTRPKPVPACSLLSQKEVEAILSPLIAAPVAQNGDPTGSRTGCEYHVPPDRGMPRSYELDILWRGGLSDLRTNAHTTRIGGMAMGGAATKGDDPLPPSGAPGEPWERAGIFYNDFVALKKDVEVKMDKRGLDEGKVKALVAAAMGKF
jgi:hypothetical protein